MLLALDLERRTDALKGMRDALGDALAAEGVQGLLREHIVLAADEACSNAMLHVEGEPRDKPIRLEAALHDGLLTIRMGDVGAFSPDPQHLQRPIDHHVRQKLPGGLGLKLMHAIMDEVQYAESDGVHWCILRKRVRAARQAAF